MKTLFLLLTLLCYQVPYKDLEICELEETIHGWKVVEKPLKFDQKIIITCNKKVIGFYYYKSNYQKLRDEHVGTYIKRTNKFYWDL